MSNTVITLDKDLNTVKDIFDQTKCLTKSYKMP